MCVCVRVCVCVHRRRNRGGRGVLGPPTLNLRGASNIFGPTTFTKCIKFIFHLRNNSFKYFYDINMSQNLQLFQSATFGR